MAVTVAARMADRFLVNVTGNAGISQQIAPGSGFPDSTIVYSSGSTGTNLINACYVTATTVTAGSNVDIDLTALTDINGAAMTFSKVKTIKVAVSAITTADTNPQLKVGPQSVANGAVLCFAATTGAVVAQPDFQNDAPVVGWGVTASNKVLRLNGSGAYDVTANVMILGTT